MRQQTDIDLIVAEELAACDRMLQCLDDAENAPERVERRERISKHIGRQFLSDKK